MKHSKAAEDVSFLLENMNSAVPCLNRGIFMYVYIDESSDSRYFFMAATVTDVENDLAECIRIARNWVRKKNKNSKRKIKLPEFKESQLFRQFPEVKELIIDNLVCKRKGKRNVQRTNVEISCVFFDRHNPFTGEHAIYKQLAVELLALCVGTSDEIINVTFDQYGDHFFKEELYQLIRIRFPNLNLNLSHQNSLQCWQLQAADLVVGTLRRGFSGEDKDNYKKISPLVKSIREIIVEKCGITRGPGVPSIMP